MKGKIVAIQKFQRRIKPLDLNTVGSFLWKKKTFSKKRKSYHLTKVGCGIAEERSGISQLIM